MLDIRFIVENTQLVKDAMATRSGTYDVDKVVELDKKRREIIGEVETLKADRNKITAEVAKIKRVGGNADELIARQKTDGEKIKTLDAELSRVTSDLRMAALSIPNIPDKSVPIGKDDSENVEQRRFMQPTHFDFQPKAHWDIGSDLDILDPVTAAKITGARFTVYKGLGARLERSVYNFMLDTHIANGYTEIFPPYPSCCRG